MPNGIAVSSYFRIADNILYQRSPSTNFTKSRIYRQPLMFNVYWHGSSHRFVEIFVKCLRQVSKAPCCYWTWDWSSIFPFTLWSLDYISADGKNKGIHLLCIFCRIDDFFFVSHCQAMYLAILMTRSILEGDDQASALRLHGNIKNKNMTSR